MNSRYTVKDFKEVLRETKHTQKSLYIGDGGIVRIVCGRCGKNFIFSPYRIPKIETCLGDNLFLRGVKKG